MSFFYFSNTKLLSRAAIIFTTPPYTYQNTGLLSPLATFCHSYGGKSVSLCFYFQVIIRLNIFLHILQPFEFPLLEDTLGDSVFATMFVLWTELTFSLILLFSFGCQVQTSLLECVGSTTLSCSHSRAVCVIQFRSVFCFSHFLCITPVKLSRSRHFGSGSQSSILPFQVHS